MSLDEKIMTIYRLKKLIPAHKYPEPTADEITEKTVVKEVARIQKISQGKTLDERVRLLKFTMIGEKHRDLVFSARKKYLTGESVPTIWQDEFPERYEKAVKLYGEDKVAEMQLEYIKSAINSRWSGYLEFASWLRESIHLAAIGGEDPAEEYNIRCESYYETMSEELTEDMGKALEALIAKGVDGFKIPKPKRIFTYLLEDSGDELERHSIAEALMGEIDYDEYGEEYESYRPSDYDKKEKENEKAGKTEKKGFFAKLFKK